MEIIPLPQRKQRTRYRAVLAPAQPVYRATVTTTRTARNRRRRARRRAQRSGIMPTNPVQVSPAIPVQNVLMPQPLGTSTGRNNMIRQRLNKVPLKSLTPEGVRFLKCAFSAADFDGTGTYGVPDRFAGKSSAYKHRSVGSVNFAPNRDTYFLLCPIPGYAYFTADVAAGTPILANTVWTGVKYSDYNALFLANPAVAFSANGIVQKFRFVSNHFEMVPTTNANTWTGSVQAYKLPVQFQLEENSTIVATNWGISGLEGTNANNADMYTGPYNLGTYVGAFNKGSEAWEFSPVIDGLLTVPAVLAPYDFCQLDGAGNALPGFDNAFETVCIKISGVGANALNSAIIKTWACVEYQFTPGSAMYSMQNLKCMEDKVALDLYRRVILELPTGVSYYDNANFWQRVLAIIKTISGGLSFVPGPYGMVASGVNTVARGIESLTL